MCGERTEAKLASCCKHRSAHVISQDLLFFLSPIGSTRTSSRSGVAGIMAMGSTHKNFSAVSWRFVSDVNICAVSLCNPEGSLEMHTRADVHFCCTSSQPARLEVRDR